MKSFLIFIVFLFIGVQPALAKQTTLGLDINSPKDALIKINKDYLGIISLEDLYADILNGTVYSERTDYPAGYVAVESHGHSGSVSFEFEPPYDIDKSDVAQRGRAMRGVEVDETDTRIYLTWQSFGFACSLEFDSDEDFPLFYYVCNYRTQ